MAERLRDIWSFPEHHVSLGWWIAIALASGPVWRGLKVLPVWGRRIRYQQRATKIRVLMSLHQNTYGLVIYLAKDVISIAFDLVWSCGALFFMSIRSLPITSRTVISLLTLNVASSVLGQAIRIRGILSGLSDYDTTIERLRAQQQAVLERQL